MSMRTLFILFCVVLIIFYISYLRKTKNPFMNGFLGVVTGILFLIPACLIAQQVGIPLQVNYSTLGISAILGAPGVVLMMVFMGL